MSINRQFVHVHDHRNLSVKQVNGVIDFELEVNDSKIRIHEDASGIHVETTNSNRDETQSRSDYYSSRAEFAQGNNDIFKIYQRYFDTRNAADLDAMKMPTGRAPFPPMGRRPTMRPPFPDPFSRGFGPPAPKDD